MNTYRALKSRKMEPYEGDFVKNSAHALSRTVAILMAGLALGLSASTALADSSVWVVTDPEQENNRLYLGGTVHLLRAADYPLPQEYDTAYAKSDELFFETDISGMNTPAVQARMMSRLTYNDERTLESVLTLEAYSALSNYLMSLGMPIQMFAKFKPGLVVSTIQVLEFQKLGFTPQGVDAHFNDRGVQDSRPIGELESIDEQIEFIAEMGEGNESEFILLSLEDMDQISTTMDQMLSAWRQGDSEALADLFVDDMKNEAPDLYNSLLVERNNNWMPLIEEMFLDSDTEFVLVGAAHLVGEHGLLAQLEAKGYSIDQL